MKMNTKIGKEMIPWLMAAGRAALGPVLVVGTKCSWNGAVLAAMVVGALLSDIFDGVLARRWKCDTAGVRLFDSMADTVFYLCVAAALWMGQPEVLRHYAGLLILLLILEAQRFALDFIKFGKPASYHSYLAKAWGLTMAVGVVAVFWTRHPSPILSCALWLGVACNLEGLMMSAILPVWVRDVKTLRVAWQLRRDLVGPSREMKRARASKVMVNVAIVLALLFGLSTSRAAYAVERREAAYAGGSTGITRDTVGILDTSSPAALIFKYKMPDGRPGQLEMNYKDIQSFTHRDEATHQLGILPLIAVSLVSVRAKRHTVSIAYGDANGATQVAIFEVASSDRHALLEVLVARDPQICSRPSTACGGLSWGR
jgi:CDP-diacylglycerol--glycerol-3-phosphate 3-phosphatidyltransferase